MAEMTDLTKELISGFEPQRPEDGHKNTFGTALICAGSEFMTGAAVMATGAALRSGAGLVKVFSGEKTLDAIRVAEPCALLSLRPQKTAELLRKVKELCGSSNAVLIGSGIPQDMKDLEALICRFLENADNVVLDAGALISKPDQGFGNIGPIHIAVFVLLFLANPFICFRYYRMPWWGKIMILAVKVFKAYLIVSYTVSLLLPRLNVKIDDLQDFLISYLNQTLEKYTEKFMATAGSFSTVVGVLAGGVHVVGTVLLLILAAIVIPSVIFLVVKYVQLAWDWVVNMLIIKRFFPQRR